jgi:hypothetical protein
MNRIALFLALPLVAACSSSSSPSPDDPASVAAAIVGNWQDTCFDAGNGQHAQLTFAIEAERWAVDYVVHGDATCTAPLGDVHIAGTYQILEASPTVSGANDAVFSFDTRTVTPKAQPFADYLDSLEGCGAGGFQVGVAADIKATGCAAIGSYPQASCSADYDVVKTDGTTLQFGARPADNNMCSADKRPTALNPNALHRL